MAKPKGAAKTGGRQKGVPNKITRDIKLLAQEHGPDSIKELARLAKEADQPTARIAAIKELLDRGYGKAAQPVTGEGGSGPIQHAIEVTFVGSPAKGNQG